MMLPQAGLAWHTWPAIAPPERLFPCSMSHHTSLKPVSRRKRKSIIATFFANHPHTCRKHNVFTASMGKPSFLHSVHQSLPFEAKALTGPDVVMYVPRFIALSAQRERSALYFKQPCRSVPTTLMQLADSLNSFPGRLSQGVP